MTDEGHQILFCRQAAEVAKLLPRRLCFTQEWYTFRRFVLNQSQCLSSEWQMRSNEALRIAAKGKPLNRPGCSDKRKMHS